MPKRYVTKTFNCMCGHVAYWVKYYGWHCFCGNPRLNGVEKTTRSSKGPLVR